MEKIFLREGIVYEGNKYFLKFRGRIDELGWLHGSDLGWGGLESCGQQP